MGGWGRDVWRTLVHMNPEEASHGLQRQVRPGEGRGGGGVGGWGRDVLGWGRDVFGWGRDEWGWG